MNTNRKALDAYGSVSLEHQIESASPHALVVMLFDGAIKSINLAKFHIQQGRIADKGMAVSKAISIIEDGLRASLEKGEGNELAENLDALYEYAAHQLLWANLHNDAAVLDEIGNLMNDLRASWLSIKPEFQSESQAADVQNHGRLIHGRV
ncbi:flagellar export chaperone FliS [Chitinibacter sp. S2-10]|uniref:flagellar export chaperone FliS n=1 Tax=Chitinibacter sp. S2-10 TaxID=3373597 RepID=UPI003977D891